MHNETELQEQCRDRLEGKHGTETKAEETFQVMVGSSSHNAGLPL